MAFDATKFRSRLEFGGARPNLYEVTMSFPAGLNGADEEFTYMCRAAQLPGMNVGIAQVPYFGRFIKLHGDRTFEDWSVRVINDEDFKVRNAFEAWQNRLAMIDWGTNSIENAGGNWQDLHIDITVTQMGKDGNTRLKVYTLHNAWPTNIGPIELAWDMNDTVEEFSVQFSYDYFTNDKISGTSVSL